jgi:hypothetical protein
MICIGSFVLLAREVRRERFARSARLVMGNPATKRRLRLLATGLSRLVTIGNRH